jgi:hypothetical protein
MKNETDQGLYTYSINHAQGENTLRIWAHFTPPGAAGMAEGIGREKVFTDQQLGRLLYEACDE